MIFVLMTIMLSSILTFIIMLMFWYNGVLDVNVEDDGDSLKLNINEYDLIKRRKFMIILINKK